MDDSDGWITSKKRRGRKSTEPSAAEPEQQQCVDYWSPGELVIVLMRGVPGSGKSTHAAKIAAAAQAAAQKPPNAAPVAAVLSSDDFFIHAGRYCFEVDRLTEAHEWNKKQCLEAMENGTPLIIIDNTNTAKWHMLPYVELAMRFNYNVKLHEVTTRWAQDADECARRCKHGVESYRISRMLSEFENATVGSLLQMASKNEKRAFRGKPPSQQQPYISKTSPLDPKSNPQFHAEAQRMFERHRHEAHEHQKKGIELAKTQNREIAELWKKYGVDREPAQGSWPSINQGAYAASTGQQPYPAWTADSATYQVPHADSATYQVPYADNATYQVPHADNATYQVPYTATWTPGLGMHSWSQYPSMGAGADNAAMPPKSGASTGVAKNNSVSAFAFPPPPPHDDEKTYEYRPAPRAGSEDRAHANIYEVLPNQSPGDAPTFDGQYHGRVRSIEPEEDVVTGSSEAYPHQNRSSNLSSNGRLVHSSSSVSVRGFRVNSQDSLQSPREPSEEKRAERVDIAPSREIFQARKASSKPTVSSTEASKDAATTALYAPAHVPLWQRPVQEVSEEDSISESARPRRESVQPHPRYDTQPNLYMPPTESTTAESRMYPYPRGQEDPDRDHPRSPPVSSKQPAGPSIYPPQESHPAEPIMRMTGDKKPLQHRHSWGASTLMSDSGSEADWRYSGLQGHTQPQMQAAVARVHDEGERRQEQEDQEQVRRRQEQERERAREAQERERAREAQQRERERAQEQERERAREAQQREREKEAQQRKAREQEQENEREREKERQRRAKEEQQAEQERQAAARLAQHEREADREMEHDHQQLLGATREQRRDLGQASHASAFQKLSLDRHQQTPSAYQASKPTVSPIVPSGSSTSHHNTSNSTASHNTTVISNASHAGGMQSDTSSSSVMHTNALRAVSSSKMQKSEGDMTSQITSLPMTSSKLPTSTSSFREADEGHASLSSGAVSSLMSMGFAEDQSRSALLQANGDVSRAVTILASASGGEERLQGYGASADSSAHPPAIVSYRDMTLWTEFYHQLCEPGKQRTSEWKDEMRLAIQQLSAYPECREHVEHAQKLLAESEAPHTSSLASSKNGSGPIDSAAKLNAMFPMLSVEFLEELLERFGGVEGCIEFVTSVSTVVSEDEAPTDALLRQYIDQAEGKHQESTPKKSKKKEGSRLQRLRAALPTLGDATLKTLLEESESYDAALAKGMHIQEQEHELPPLPEVYKKPGTSASMTMRNVWTEPNPPKPISFRSVEKEQLAQKAEDMERVDPEQEVLLASKLKKERLMLRFPECPPTEVEQALRNHNYSEKEAAKYLHRVAGVAREVSARVPAQSSAQSAAPAASSRFAFPRADDATRSKVADVRRQIKSASAKAAQTSDPHVASFYKSEVTRLSKELKALNDKSAGALLEKNNPDGIYGSKLDLHGLHVKEAIEVVKEVLDYHLANPGVKTVEFITGRGVHSEGKAKLRPAVRNLLRNKCLELDETTGGFVVDTKQIKRK